MSIITIKPGFDLQQHSDFAVAGDVMLFSPGTYGPAAINVKPGVIYDGSNRAAVLNNVRFSGNMTNGGIRGFAFTDGPFCITSQTPSNYFVTDCTFTDCAEAVHFEFFSGGGNVTIARNRLSGTKRIGIECQSNVQKDTKTGIGLLVEDNRIEQWGAGLPGQGNGHMGLSIATGKDPNHGNTEPTGIVVRRNTILGTGTIDAANSTPIEIMGTAEVYGNYTSGGARGAAIIVGQSHGGIQIHDNTLLGCTGVWEGEPGFAAAPAESNNLRGPVGSVPVPVPVPFVLSPIAGPVTPTPTPTPTGATPPAPTGFKVVGRADGFHATWDALPAGASAILEYRAAGDSSINGTLPAATSAVVTDSAVLKANWIVNFTLTYTLNGQTSPPATATAQAPAVVGPLLPPQPPVVPPAVGHEVMIDGVRYVPAAN